MRNRERAGAAFVAAALVLGSAALGWPLTAEARHRGRHGFHGGGFHGGARFGFGPGFRSYWGPWGFWSYWGPYGPHAHSEGGGVPMSFALMAGFGALDLNVKPGAAEVWVDGKFVGEARDLDGYPSFLWLQEGEHRVQIYKGGHVSFDERLEVRRGTRRELKVRLEKGDSQPPGARPEKTPAASRS